MDFGSYGKLSTYQAPEFAAGLPNIPKHRIKLAMAPTPIHEWKLPDVPPGFKLFIKRDDMTGNFTSGNKIRKLEFLLAEAIANGYESVVTSGSVQSNHCRATSVAAREVGLDCHLLVRSHDIEGENARNPGNALPAMLNGTHRYVMPWDTIPDGDLCEREKKLSERIKRKTGKLPYLIPVGGSNIVGLFGYIEAWDEMMKQNILEEIDDIFFACGSAGTLAGLAVANYLTGQQIGIHGVDISDEYATEGYAYSHLNDILNQLNLTDVRAEDIVDVIGGYAGEGYGYSTKDDNLFVEKISRSTGIFCDLVYTGKAVRGMLEVMRNNPSRLKGKRVMFIHSGGTMGLFDGTFQSSLDVTFGTRTYMWQNCDGEPKKFD